MTIERLKKATLAGVVADKDQILLSLQTLGCMHLMPLENTHQTPVDADGVHAERYHRALNYLLSSPVKRRQVSRSDDFSPQEITEEVIQNATTRRELSDRRDFLIKRIKDLEPWGHFNLPAESELSGQRLWFYLVPNYKMLQMESSDLIWQRVHQDNRYSYVAVIKVDEPSIQAMPAMRTHTGRVPLQQLRRELESIEIELEEKVAIREALTRWIYLLQRSMAAIDDMASRELAANATLDNEFVFAVQGWVPESRLKQLEAFSREQCLALILEAPRAEEAPPSLLNNPESLGGGEEIIRFYQIPGYRSWDPSRVVFFSFALFYALILSDAGYAAVMGGLMLGFWKKMGRSRTGRRLRVLGGTLALTSLVYGILVGSYFGAAAPFAPLASLQLLDINDFDQMMGLSVVVGTGHIVLANIISAWHQRESLQALSSLGWVWILVGALSYWLAETAVLSVFLAAMGVVSVLLFSSTRSWGGGRLMLLRTADGLLALTGISKVFGDVLSYLRLFALGLASASLAITFNQLAVDVAASGGGLGFFGQILILVLGHLVNFALAVVSGVIHGLRLNLLEFYNWGISDEGYAFQSFAKKEVEPWVT